MNLSFKRNPEPATNDLESRVNVVDKMVVKVISDSLEAAAKNIPPGQPVVDVQNMAGPTPEYTFNPSSSKSV